MSTKSDVERLTGDAQEAAIEDAWLVADVLAGDSAAYDQLVRRHQRRAVAVAYRLLGDVHDAADVAQDAFLRAYQGLAGLEDHRRFAPWLMRIVTNLGLNFRRSRGTGGPRQALALDDAAEAADSSRSTSGEAPAGEVSPGDSSLRSELGEAVSGAIAGLPEKQRLALVLFSIEGLPQKEVAEILECSVELVKWNVFQARKALRKKLEAFLR